ncbi:BZ3500_MvSof-1268-A1-R1_Chr1-3g02306 [Microbotryum saponariae]|uniref:BZ3500_MvSof-1268-A1-R1_Chr1-3g02306 protein n=1 Tax=Microbotryum saponariae TaxID=289078 RepID=A0A2X0KUC1_9BASI|nr:BZ3500_MvSof-1268-A1-R1_Chr1-3g02306 [Microbotryum saponariae]SCZ95938.1 BZ3501_MvSof-1269-A2-R1_Chr1-3g01909 [Microbotryum saponariae]
MSIPLPNCRPSVPDRCFVSALAEARLVECLASIRDRSLQTLFSNCWLNTLDTTIFDHFADNGQADLARAQPRTWVITGDIAAMWLRDSTNQVTPYLSLLAPPPGTNPANYTSDQKEWEALYRLILGVIYAQASCINLHPFSNAFVPPTSNVSTADNFDRIHPVAPKPVLDRHGHGLRVWESKWELDSLCAFFDLSAKLAQSSSRTDFVGNEQWVEAMTLALKICRLQQRSSQEEYELLQEAQTRAQGDESSLAGGLPWVKAEGKPTYDGAEGVYQFQRPTSSASETRAMSGLGEPAKRCGLVKSAFRPSDDATVFPFLIPSNCYLVASLGRLADVVRAHILSDIVRPSRSSRSVREETQLGELEREMRALANEVSEAIQTQAMVKVMNAQGQEEVVLAYEIDGYGGYLLADDANLPSLLSLPFLGYCDNTLPLYSSTRSLVLSPRNKWHFSGSAGTGIGGMHIGPNFIWPMSIIMRALTSDDDHEILECLDMLKECTAGTGLMHESYQKDDPRRYTRSWFAWANGLFGELILDVWARNPHLLS